MVPHLTSNIVCLRSLMPWTKLYPPLAQIAPYSNFSAYLVFKGRGNFFPVFRKNCPESDACSGHKLFWYSQAPAQFMAIIYWWQINWLREHFMRGCSRLATQNILRYFFLIGFCTRFDRHQRPLAPQGSQRNQIEMTIFFSTLAHHDLQRLFWNFNLILTRVFLCNRFLHSIFDRVAATNAPSRLKAPFTETKFKNQF